MPDPVVDALTDTLESTFRQIQRGRMADVPILNPRIRVRAAGFRRWNDGFLGVMITPWFMNLMLLPGGDENWDELEELGKTRHAFPSGNYEFITGYEPGIGKYQMCSLFSPMFEFADDSAAADTADAVLRELMNRDNVDDTRTCEQEMVALWHGEVGDPAVGAQDGQGTTDDEAGDPGGGLERPLGRRQLLRAALLQAEKSR